MTKNKPPKAEIFEDKLKRALADYHNLQKRIDQQCQLFAKLAARDIIGKLLEVLDDLELTYRHLKEPGLKMIIDKFQKILESEGLTSIETQGQLFNPETMDCVDTAPGTQDTIVKVQKTGYKLNGQVIRPAQVVVGCQIKNSK